MRIYWTMALAVLAYAMVIGPSLADKRVALVIGNSSYQKVPKLRNPENDAAAISLLLKRSGFDVVEMRQNLSGADLRRSIRDFSATTTDADIAVVFYAGHGIEVGGVNYLIPTDAALRRDVDVEDEAVSVDRVLTLLEPTKRLRLVILDACRDNPFLPNMTRTLASRSVGRGLAKVEPPNSNTLIAFAAKAGSISEDGKGPNSPFTEALLRNLTTPGLDIRLALGRVHDEVMINTDKRQQPFVYGALGGSTISLASLTDEPRNDKEGTTTSPWRVDMESLASRDYEAAAKVGTVGAWDAFLAEHPTGLYAELARQRRENLIAPQTKEKATAKGEEEPKKRLKTASLPPSSSENVEKPKQKPSERGSRWECCMRFMSKPISQGGVSPDRRVQVCQSAASRWNYCKFLATNP